MNIELTKKTEISKADITEMSIQLISKLDNGEVNPLLLLQHLKAVEKIGESIKIKLTEACVREAGKYSEKIIPLFGAEFKVGEFGHKVDYTSSGDPVYTRLFEAAEKAKVALKQREEFLKAVKGSETVVDPETGEIVTITEPVRSSTTGISCSIK